MTIIDLSHSIYEGMPVYPGTEPPVFSTPCTIAKDGFTEKKITLFSHTGTHMDVPAHIIPGAATLNELPMDQFWGQACVVDVRSLVGRNIETAALTTYGPLIGEVDFVLFRSGWDKLWHKTGYFEGYPMLTPEAAEWIGGFGLKGIGVDMISVDKEESTDFPIHRSLLSQNILIIENLANLDALPPGGFRFWCLPLKIKNGDGSPVRAAAVIPGRF